MLFSSTKLLFTKWKLQFFVQAISFLMLAINNLILVITVPGKESLVSISAEAASKALQMAEVDPDDVDLILLCSSTAEDLFGSAPQVLGYKIRMIYISQNLMKQINHVCFHT